MFEKIEQNKKEIFPEINNWNDPQNQYRNENNIRAMKWRYWFWFHPSSYHLNYYGMPISGIIIFLAASIFLLLKQKVILLAITTLIMSYFVFDLVKKCKMWKYIKNTNYYDIYMREYSKRED